MLGLACPSATPAAGLHVAAAAGRPAAAATPAAAPASHPRSRNTRRRQPPQWGSGLAAASRLQGASSAAAAAPPAAASSSERGAANAVQPPGSEASSGQEDQPQIQSVSDYLQHCQDRYGKQGLIEFSAGSNGLPKATLLHPSGARCEVYLHGAAVTSWRHADGREMLHLREGNAFDGQQPISGGVQIAWPQYGVGPLPTHGFLQHLHWSVVETAWREPELEGEEGAAHAGSEQASDWRPSISLYADTDEEWAASWPHRFEALYTVSLMQPDPAEPSDTEVMRAAAEKYQPWVQRQTAAKAAAARKGSSSGEDGGGGKKGWQAQGVSSVAAEERPQLTPSVLRCLLQVHNCDDKPLTFTTGLRPHFATRDIATHPKFVKTLGLRGKYTLDYAGNPNEPRLGVEDSHSVLFGGMQEQNRLFVDSGAEGDVLFCPGSPAHFKLENKQGFSDVAVVHPAAAAPAEARHFVQMASARAVRQVTLQPGDTWVGEMIVTAHDRYWELPAWELEDSSGVPIPEQDPEQMPSLRKRATLAEIALLENQGI